RWTWKGDWTANGGSRSASERGAEVVLTLEGSGAIIVGSYLTNGGKLDAYVDGTFDRTLDVYSDEKGNRGGASVWHGFGLKNGPPAVRVVVRGETYRGSTGTAVAITDAVLFR